MIGDFIIEKMAAYISGGMNPVTAAVFTRGELEAIYKGNHYSRDKSGAMRVTPLPEELDIIAAMKKADSGIMEILNYCDEQAKGEPKMNTKKKEAPKAAPEEPPRAKKTGLEGLKNYTRKVTA